MVDEQIPFFTGFPNLLCVILVGFNFKIMVSYKYRNNLKQRKVENKLKHP